MAHIYSVEIHSYLSKEIKKARQALQEAKQCGDSRQMHYQQGRLQELLHFRAYLTKHIDLKTQNYY